MKLRIVNHLKALVKILLIAGLLVYLCFALFHFARVANEEKCSGLNIVIADSTRAGFITREEVVRLIDKAKVNPVNSAIDRVKTKEISDALLKNPFISEVICYKMADHRVAILLQQRLPLLRVQSVEGGDYYIDENGAAMRFTEYPADLVVATGHIDASYAKNDLCRMGRFLREHKFWDDQIEQIYVHKDGKMDLVPRIGAQLIHIGRPDSLDIKFRNLHVFYEKVMPQVGWDKYAKIDLRHINQVICTKSDIAQKP